MGITSLLPMVKPAIVSKTIKSYKGKRIGIDGLVWLHQALTVIAVDIYEGRETSRHINFFISKIDNLLKLNIFPIIVFDGDPLPSKKITHTKRKSQREKCREEVEYYLSKGRRSEAREMMKRCVEVTSDILYPLFIALKKKGIEYLISPYESDAQLYYLEKIKYIDCIMTEDSDLIPYGANKILFKYNGKRVDEFTRLKLRDIDDFFAANILDICILSGCDYLDSIKGVGLKTALNKLKECKNVKLFVEFFKDKKEVPENYLEEFAKAKLTFLHQIVYDPYLKKSVYLNKTNENYEFLGEIKEKEIIYNTLVAGDVVINRHSIPRDIELQQIDKENK